MFFTPVVPKDSDLYVVTLYFIKMFPNSISGQGVKSERESTTGAGRVKASCDATPGILLHLSCFFIKIFHLIATPLKCAI